VRLLARRPGFTAMAVVSLALGVGLNTTLFSVVNAVLLRNTPVQDPQRLVEIYSSLSDEFPYLTTSYPDYLSIRDGADAFSGVAAHAFVRGILSTGGTPVLITGETITPNTSTSSACAALVGRVLGSLLYGVSAHDPIAYVVAATVLLAVAALAAFVPALGAARLDPLRALRTE